MLKQINLQDPKLSELEAVALAKMIAKRESYIDQGRFREAHGLGTGIYMLWSVITDGRKYQTGFGELL